MSTFQKIEEDQNTINAELIRTSRIEGLPVPDLTGNLHVDFLNHAIWHEVISHGYTSLVTLDYPYLTAEGEILVSVQDADEADSFPNE